MTVLGFDAGSATATGAGAASAGAAGVATTTAAGASAVVGGVAESGVLVCADTTWLLATNPTIVKTTNVDFIFFAYSELTNESNQDAGCDITDDFSSHSAKGFIGEKRGL